MNLKLADDLSLPPDAVTQTFLIVGKRGSGKSNTAARLVEQFHRARLPFVVLDPVDTWWGLKAGRDREKGLDVYVFGGRKADLPLNAGDGALIAEVLCEHRTSMVLSVKHLSGRERSTFMVAFAQTLFQKWGGGPLHVVLEEAHELAPQSTQNAKEGEQAMLGAFKRLWKLGRASGIGGTAVTQRPASLSKDITTQSEILIAHRTIGPQDVKAVGEWIKYHGERLDILAELPSLPTGEAYVWAPEFPEGKAIGLQRTAVLLRDTYDSASTPKVGEKRVEPKELAPVDLERLRAKMSATIEKAKAEDPRELRKELARVRQELAQAQKDKASHQQASRPSTTVEKFVLKDGQLARAEKLIGQIDTTITRYSERVQKAIAEFDTKFDGSLSELRVIEQGIADAIARTRAPQPHATPAPRQEPMTPSKSMGGSRPAALPARPAREAAAVSNGDLSGPEHRILNAIAWMESIGVMEPEQTAVAFLAGYTIGGGAFNNPRGALRTKGYIDYRGDRFVLTEDGRAHAVFPEGALTAQELQQRVLERLPGPEQKILRVLLDAYPHPLPNDELARASGYEPNGGAFNNPRGRLRSLGLIEYPQRGHVVARPLLFLDGR